MSQVLQTPQWIVNDLGELGVKLGENFFFFYKGDSIEYLSGMHDDGTPILWRPVGKGEFGETCWPLQWVLAGRRERRYTQALNYIPGLSDGAPDDIAWRPLPHEAHLNEVPGSRAPISAAIQP